MDDSRKATSMTIHIGLVDGEPPTGVVVGDDAVSVPFAGWLELIHAISRLASRRSPDTALGAVGNLDLDHAQEVLP
jgi:hypothetical protein